MYKFAEAPRKRDIERETYAHNERGREKER